MDNNILQINSTVFGSHPARKGQFVSVELDLNLAHDAREKAQCGLRTKIVAHHLILSKTLVKVISEM